MEGYKQMFNDISVKDDLLMRGSSILIPSSLQQVLQQIHSGHQGMIKCKEGARRVIWWPGMTSQIKEKIHKCKRCCQYQKARVEPLLPSSLPELSWQKVGTDLFVWKHSTYLLIIDYYSHFIEVAELSSVKSESVILELKKIFARHGIPQLVILDNGLNIHHLHLLSLQNCMASNIVPVVQDIHKPMEKQRGQYR